MFEKNLENPVTSLNKEVRPFFLSDTSTWSFLRIIIRGVLSQGGYGFGYVSDMYPSPFRYVSDSIFDKEDTQKHP